MKIANYPICAVNSYSKIYNKYENICFSGFLSCNRLQDELTSLALKTKEALLPSYKQAGSFLFKKIGKNRLQIFQPTGEIKNPIVVPEYLYHVTSWDSMKKITEAGCFKPSEKDILGGVYFLDKDNFLTRYHNTSIGPDMKLDLSSSIFQRVASKKNNPAIEKMSIIKIPTMDLLNRGTIKVRTQEDYFYYKKYLDELSKKHGENFNILMFKDDNSTKRFKEFALNNGLMTESNVDEFVNRIKTTLAEGYSLQNAHDLGLDKKSSVEYVFLGPINLFGVNYQIKNFDITDYCEKEKYLRVSPKDLAKIFDF